MAHEELKKQYDEDVKKQGERAYKLWEYLDFGSKNWEGCYKTPSWYHSTKYRRKEQTLQPEYFSGLNWQETTIGKIYEFSEDGDKWTKPEMLVYVYVPNNENCFRPFRTKKGLRWLFARTTPETYAHPTITIGGVKLPRPEIEAPEICASVWIWKPGSVTEHSWQNYCNQVSYLNAGRVHLTESRAQEWANWWENTVMAEIKK